MPTDPLAYLEARIFEPIGLKYGEWRRDSSGMPHLPSGAFVTAREWVKLGELLRNEGKLGEIQLLDPEILRQTWKPSHAQPGYGITFWISEFGFQASGAGKQRLYVLPKHELVVVRQGESKRAFQDREFLTKLLKKQD